MRNLFPELPKPADLRLLTDEELVALLEQHQAIVKKVAEKDEDTIRGLSQKDILDQMTKGVDQIEKIREEQVVRGQADEDFENQMKSLSEKAGIAEPTDEEKATEEVEAEAEATEEALEVAAEAEATEEAPEAEETPEVAEEAAEPVVAAAPPTAPAKLPSPMDVRRPPIPQPSVEHQPIVVKEQGLPALVASIGIPDIEPGSKLDMNGLARAVFALRHQALSAPAGFQDKAVVASVNWGDRFPEERKLTGDFAMDWEKVQGVVGKQAKGIDPVTQEEAVIASGGLCAPVTPYYELMNVATAARPVRDALAGFNAVRGGLNFAAVPTIADVTDGVGIKTAAQDAAGGTFATKTCQVVECPDFSEVLLSMIYHCVQFGNLNSRAWPEQVAQFNDLVFAAHARLAETALLDGIASASVQVDGAAWYGATSTIINQVLIGTANMRSSLRMPVGSRFRGLFPAWARDIIAADVASSQFERFGVAPGDVDGLLRRYGVEPTWYLDTATGAGQIITAQTDGPQRDFPAEIVYYLFPEGSFLFLDGGTLELGIVRDSTLNSTNDYQIFGETFENVAFVGPVSFEITSEICQSGTVAAPATALTCSPS